ncbi:MAG: hypothetical protein HYX42_21600 [Polaromonas sp.]|uniref:hypothetical protein n=1 Tax=Polaromonas sp. TaxID=1869339 RepID=UPI0025D8DFE8|nr:hypothetical protein [Polaromonas sp.]MBI2728844.1 hypothetical protein [Polaromonas sp.]
MNLPAGMKIPAVLFLAPENAETAINSVAAHARIYWSSADLVPENGHFLTVLRLPEASKSRQSPKC